jgi:hypothetical protein
MKLHPSSRVLRPLLALSLAGWPLMLLPSAGAQAIPAASVAPTPPMGWNSWDSYRLKQMV